MEENVWSLKPESGVAPYLTACQHAAVSSPALAAALRAAAPCFLSCRAQVGDTCFHSLDCSYRPFNRNTGVTVVPDLR